MYEKNINIIMGNQIATSYVRKRDCYNQLKVSCSMNILERFVLYMAYEEPEKQ